MEWDNLPTDGVIEKTLTALREHKFQVVVTNNRQEALAKLKELIPAGASVMTGASTTLDQIGFTDYLVSKKHPYRNLKDGILAEKNPEKQAELRRQAILADYYLGSVQAIAQTGEVVSCDASGTRTGPYAYGPRHILWVAGTNKIVANSVQCLRRIREHCVPLEDQRMKSLGYPGTTLSRILIYERELDPQRITLILAKEKLGF